MLHHRFTPRIIILILLIIFQLPVHAATYTVTNLNDSGAGSLRQAVANANAAAGNDTIRFSVSGMITLTTGLLTITDSLEIEGYGYDDASASVISGNNASRIFEVTSGDAVSLRGLTLQNGYNATHGGAIYNAGALTIRNSILTNNRSDGGGGAIANGGSLTITESTFSNNVAVTEAGCIGNGQNPPSSLTITNSTLSDNSAFLGGCLYNASPLAVTITASTFSGNNAGRDGAAILNAESAGALNIVDSVFFNNRAAGSGGGIYNRATLVVSNSTLSGNAATTHDGGALWTGGNSHLTVSQSTITGNSAVFSGGGLWLYGARTTISNSIISGNQAPSGKEIQQDNSTSGGVFNSLGYNLVGENGSSGVSGVTLTASDRILAGSVSSALSPLADNGGRTQTHFPVSRGPVVDSGSNALIPTGITTDQRGEMRIVGEAVDIGAVESNWSSSGFAQVSAGAGYTCALKRDQTIACWGNNDLGQATPPTGNFIQISTGFSYYHNCGIRDDHTVACWGNNNEGQATPPAGSFIQISSGYYHTCGVKSDGTVACWGSNGYGEATPPSGRFTQVSAGNRSSCGVTDGSQVVCWGYGGNGEALPPSGSFAQVTTGDGHACALSFTPPIPPGIVCWGLNSDGQATTPGGYFSQISGGGKHTCGVSLWGGSAVCWGSNNFGQATPPADQFTQVSSGAHHTCGLKSDAAVVCWGSNEYGQLGSGGVTEVTATHQASLGYSAGGTVTITNELTVPAGAQLLSLGWRPTLPSGWSLQGVSGDGSPDIQQGNEIVFLADSLTSNPIQFTYQVSVPAGVSGTQSITAVAEYHLLGTANPTTVSVLPALELTEEVGRQIADYRDPPWNIDGTEASRVLAYWRMGSYHVDPAGADGYASGVGTTGVRHSADYREPYWVIDAAEANRILAYWRAGGYHVDPTGLDGYAPGLVSASLHPAAQASAPQVTHQIQDTAPAGDLVNVQVTISHAGDLISLLARPELPSGWTITEVTGEGNPQVLGTEILLTDQDLPNPLTFQYRVRIPATAQGLYHLRTSLEHQSIGMVNPATLYAAENPLSITVGSGSHNDAATILITHYYTSILGRQPEATGLTFWLGLIAEKQTQGLESKPVFREMANAFFNSTEYLENHTGDSQFITDLYRTFFQREPDQGGIDFWLGQLAAGTPRHQAMGGFLHSPEFTTFMENLGF